MIGRRFSLPAPTRSKSGRQPPVASNTNTDARQRKCTTENRKTPGRAHPSCVAWKPVVSAVSPHLEQRIGTDSLRCTLKLEKQHGSGVGQVPRKGLQPHSSHRTRDDHTHKVAKVVLPFAPQGLLVPAAQHSARSVIIYL